MQIVEPGTSLYFAGKEMQIKYEAVVSAPANIPVKLNLYVVFPLLTREIKKSLSPLNTSGDYKATFDINNVLYSELFTRESTKTFAFPGDPDEPIRKRNTNMLEFYMDWSYTYVDENGDVQETGRTDNSGGTTYWTIQGGISRIMQQYLYNENITFMQWLNASNTALKFLSWMPNNLPVHPSQPVRLWFYNHTKLDTVKLKIKAFFTDGTTSAVTDGMGIASGKGLLEIACGPYELRIPTIDITKTVSSYQIWLENSDGTIKTETKTFVIDYTTYERNDILFFRTSLGVNEVLWCHGRRSETITTTSTERTQPLGNHIYEGGTIRTYRANLTYPFKMNTGWFPKNMRYYLADFISASEAKLPVKFFYMPVIIKPGTFNWGEDGEDLFSLEFTIQVAHTENYYSPVPNIESPWGDFNNDFNEDLF